MESNRCAEKKYSSTRRGSSIYVGTKIKEVKLRTSIKPLYRMKPLAHQRRPCIALNPRIARWGSNSSPVFSICGRAVGVSAMHLLDRGAVEGRTEERAGR
jgi:hypothetical protein